MSSISFDCRIQSNSIHRLSSIEFDWIGLKFSSIGFDLLCRDYVISGLLAMFHDFVTTIGYTHHLSAFVIPGLILERTPGQAA